MRWRSIRWRRRRWKSCTARQPCVTARRPSAAWSQRGIAFVGKGALTSADRGQESAALLDTGGRNVALHVDAFERRAGDYTLPSGDRQANSWVSSKGHSVGASFVFDQGFVGASVTRLLARYGIPGEEAAANGNAIDLDQTRFQAKGEYRPDAQAIAAVRLWFGATQYQHDERGTEDDVTGILSTFRNRQQEGRVEIEHAPLASPFGMWSGALGVQVGRQRIAPQRLGGGLFWRNENWLAKVGLLHAFAQNRVGDNETPTAGYHNLKAELSYTHRYRPSDFGPRELVLGVSASNLLDDDMRNRVSFNKNEVLLPGRSIKGLATMRF